ncbi:hypothetical protein KDA_41110 [Dictyobacter alpinus]|uniref:3-keto-disaccharide hydrolase domain-containing protein n=1 Tax=Dictyobacter alpinus TaxID=2014873 RepID=A0A402BBH7_9CHLR|nr:hypothetical protein [Dictyobacter alpinus]GCE28627.1 hypothetical protein KDA_41110 [Dictyobacter alpinus]
MVSEKKRRRRYYKLLAWTALLLLILISSSIIFADKIKGRGDPLVNMVATATKAVTRVATTPAVTPTATASPSVTATATPTPLFEEEFLDNHNGWAISSSSGYIRSVADNKLTLSVNEHKILIENVPTSAPLSNYVLNFSYVLQQADKHDKVGLYLRGDSNLDHDYRIDILGDNSIGIFKESLDDNKLPQDIELKHISKVPSMKSIGHENRVQVSMNGPRMTIKVNGVEVAMLEDYDYTKGQLALFVNNGWSSDEATASFISMDIQSIPDPLPGLTPTPTDGGTGTPEGTPSATPTATATSKP